MNLRFAALLALLAVRGAAAEGTYAFERAFASLTFSRPVFLTAAPGEPGKLYVVEQGGTIRSFDTRKPDKAPVFLDIHERVTQRGGEEGLLGLAFHPEYAKNHRFYVYYSAADEPRRQVVAQFPGGKVLREFPDPYRNHNGGMLAFGPDGMLYVASGDGGSAGDPQNHAQDLSSYLGKILRYAPDGSVPADNPFVAQKGALPDVWAYGLRNPWRFSFDRQTGALWAGDVGQNLWEEVDRIVKGGNYGWRLREGRHDFNDPDHRAQGLVEPVAEYGHDQGCSVTGGYVYRGARLPALRGQYVYGDFCSGKVWALPAAADGATPRLIANVPSPSSFGEDAAGELYAVSYDGKLYALVGQ